MIETHESEDFAGARPRLEPAPAEGCTHRLPAHVDDLLLAHLCATCRELMRMIRAGEVPF